jgi:putative peptidoglycan lipid II flippase
VWVNAIMVSGLTALVKVTGAVKTVAIARFFGASAELDAYLLAFLIPSFIADVFCGAIVPALVPRLIELMHQGKETAVRDLYSEALWRSVTFVGCIAVVLAVAAGLLLTAHTGGRRTTLACSLSLLMIPILPLSAISNVWRATLHVNGRFVVTAGASALAPIVIILSLAVAGSEVYWLAAGTTIGALAETLALHLGLRGLKMSLSSRAPSRWQLCGRVALREYGSLAVTNFVLGSSVFLDQSMAAMVGSGAVSVLNYGTRLVAVLIAIGPEAFGITLLPRLSNIMVKDGHRQVRPLLEKCLPIAMFWTAIVAGVLVCISGLIVKLVLKHGVFSASDTLTVASVQKLSLLQLPFAVGAALLTRFIASAKLNRILIPISAVSLFLNAVLNLLLMRRFSVAGIALSTTVAQAAMFTLLLIAVCRILCSQESLAC